MTRRRLFLCIRTCMSDGKKWNRGGLIRCGTVHNSNGYSKRRSWSEQIYMREPQRACRSTGRRSLETPIKGIYIDQLNQQKPRVGRHTLHLSRIKPHKPGTSYQKVSLWKKRGTCQPTISGYVRGSILRHITLNVKVYPENTHIVRVCLPFVYRFFIMQRLLSFFLDRA
jgi:hypothetical protein